jgi:hypothetical protein
MLTEKPATRPLTMPADPIDVLRAALPDEVLESLTAAGDRALDVVNPDPDDDAAINAVYYGAMRDVLVDALASALAAQPEPIDDDDEQLWTCENCEKQFSWDAPRRVTSDDVPLCAPCFEACFPNDLDGPAGGAHADPTCERCGRDVRYVYVTPTDDYLCFRCYEDEPSPEARTCATCRHWVREIDDSDSSASEWKPLTWGECHSQFTNPKKFRANRGMCIHTDEGFGCTLHEPAPPATPEGR